MKCRTKLIIAVLVSIILTFGITAIAIEYSIQNAKYGDDVMQTSIQSKDKSE